MMTFDSSLNAFVSALASGFSGSQIERGRFVRNVSGRLAFIVAGDVSDGLLEQTQQHAEEVLGRYAVGEGRTIMKADAPGASFLLAQREVVRETLHLADGSACVIELLDRRIVGQDWLADPAPAWLPPAPGRLAFCSLKGGVGRSTALAVLASDLAADGYKILVVDLDLEAPGVGTMLLSEDAGPEYGAVDWFVETALGEVDDEFLSAMTAPSRFSEGRGMIDVVPAVGRSSDRSPETLLAKLARAYLEAPSHDGTPESFLVRCRHLIDRLLDRQQYDAVLLDTRAGLHETTAAAILGLGADILLFGLDTPQTFKGYRFLLSHLARFRRCGDADDWALRLRMVHAMASPERTDQVRFRDKAFTLFDDTLYRRAPPDDASSRTEDRADADAIDPFSLDDETAPHFAWTILGDSTYQRFDPQSDPRHLNMDFYNRTFGAFIGPARERLGLIRDQK